MATVRVEPPFARPLDLRAERLVMAGCVSSRTAASEQRNSWNPWVPDRQLCGSRNDRSGSLPPVRWTEDLSFDSSEYQIVAWSAL